MTSFRDGPAAGQVLALRRSPKLLRVVVNRAGVWDACDQVEDDPRPQETVHVYKLVGSAGHVCVRGKGRGCYPISAYEHVPDAPGEKLSDRAAWQAWAIAFSKKEKEDGGERSAGG